MALAIYAVHESDGRTDGRTASSWQRTGT